MSSFAADSALGVVVVSLAATSLSNAQCTARWLGAHAGPALGGSVRAITEWDADGAGPNPALPVVGGAFGGAGLTQLNNIAAWTPSGWAPVGGGTTGGQLLGQVSALAVLPGGDLVAGGLFTTAGGVPAANIARFDGTSWHPLGDGLTGQGGATLGGVRALLVLSNGDLIAGGDFSASGATTLNRIARWDGTQWSPLGTGMTRQSGMVYTPAVFALALASNADIVAAGQWTHADGIPAQHIARYDGSGWLPMGAGFNAYVTALTALSTGEIIAGGEFTSSGGTPLTRVALWNGAWSAMGSGFDAVVRGLTTDSTGAPVAIGFFTRSGAPTVNRIGRWTGTVWSSMGTGLSGDGLCVRPLDNGEIAAGGNFATAGGASTYGMGRWTPTNAPWLAAHPAAADAPCGGSASFSATAAPGFAGTTYQWRRDGNPISLAQNATAQSATLLVEPVTPAAAGTYDCIITSTCGAATSETAALAVTSPCCVADFDQNGFVNGDDADTFAALFEAGDISADINGDTFVTGDDFDLFTGHFAEGC